MVWIIAGLTGLIILLMAFQVVPLLAGFGLISERSWDTPQPYIDHPDGGGTPPGMKDP